jgi:hypothetical protein
MIIYWETLEKNAGDTKTIPEYMASDYFPYVRRAFSLFNKVKCRVFLSGDQTDLTSGVYHKVLFDDYTFNPGGYFNFDNSEFKVPQTGYYLITASILLALRTLGIGAQIRLKVNSSFLSTRITRAVNDNVFNLSLTDILYLQANDVISLWYYFYDPGHLSTISGGEDASLFAVHLLST